MTTLEALISESMYPIPENAILRICVFRELDSSLDFSNTIATSEAYELATADIFRQLSTSPDLMEQETSVKNVSEVLKNLDKKANTIYAKYDDDAYTGQKFGFIGENYND